MREHALQNPSPSVTWVLVADAGQARIYLCNKTVHRVPLGGANKNHAFEESLDYELLLAPDGVLDAESIDDYQIGHDLRGRSSSSNSPTHNTYEPHGDINEELRQRFVRALAEKVRIAGDAHVFDRLVLVAPARIVTDLKALWNVTITNKIATIIPKDLMQYHGPALMDHLRTPLAEADIT